MLKFIKVFLVAIVAFLFSNFTIKLNQPNIEVRDVLDNDFTKEKSGKKINRINITEPQYEMSEVKAQISMPSEDRCHIRFVVGIDSLMYDAVGFNIVVKDGEYKIKNYDTKLVTTVYTHLMAYEQVLSAGEAFGEQYNYLAAFTINNIPKEAWNYDFDVYTILYNENTTYMNNTVTKNIYEINNAESNVKYYFDNKYPESNHPYTDEDGETKWNYTSTSQGNALRVTFSEETYLHGYYATLFIEVDGEVLDMKGYMNSELSGKTIIIPSMSFKIYMRALDDNYEEAYGFSITNIEPVEGITFSYIVENNEAIITGTNGTGDLVIPSYIDGYKVVGIAYRAFMSRNLYSVYIPSTIRFIEDDAFFWNFDLTDIYVESLESYLNIEFETNGASPFINANLNRDLMRFYEGTELITDLVIPDSIKTLKSYSLWYMGLTSINLNNVETIEYGAIGKLYKLEKLTIGGNLTYVGENNDLATPYNTPKQVIVNYSNEKKVFESNFLNFEDVEIYIIDVNKFLYNTELVGLDYTITDLLNNVNLYVYAETDCPNGYFHKVNSEFICEFCGEVLHH